MTWPRAATDAEGAEVELEATNMAHGGVAVARLEGRVVFVPDVIPGERVLARVVERKKSFWRAEALRILEPSPHRLPHVWREASIERPPEHRAGGADYGHITLEHQRALKAGVLADALRRVGGIDRTVPVEAVPRESMPSRGAGDPDEDGTGWRTRVRLHVDADGRPGPMAARSHRVVPVADMPLATAELRAILPLTERFPGIDTVDALAPSVGGPRLIVGHQAPSLIRERVGRREFRLDDSGFWQVHPRAAETLTRAVQDALDPGLLDPSAANLDLYGGVGVLAAALGDLVGSTLRIASVESDPRASGHAAENLADWVGARAVTATVESWVRELANGSAGERERLGRATVILDPPRAGAGRAVLEALATVRPAQLVYVACDPVAFARDAATLAGLGYRATGIRAFDLFPSTHHIEAVGSFVRDRSASRPTVSGPAA